MSGPSAGGAAPDERGGLARDIGWSALAVGFVVAGYTFVYVRNERFFFTDDLQHTLLATIYELGRQIRHGVWPMVQHRAWNSSFVLGDPQYGLFNPITLLSASRGSGPLKVDYVLPARGPVTGLSALAILLLAASVVAGRRLRAPTSSDEVAAALRRLRRPRDTRATTHSSRGGAAM